MPFFKKKKKKKMLKAGGVILMAINNTLMMVQTGYPTGECEVRSRLEQLWKRTNKL